ncbi:tetratricopeptide repeat protein [Amycolatopsis australiensis]|uniref:tetratricopeptide repeat protein n=1 Tax=Amycolatopsis australiensis TaxID=546364 RepID=UPI000930B72A|nr:tetratricopeptide repeat protein [Amycolatopsis australiensis]
MYFVSRLEELADLDQLIDEHRAGSESRPGVAVLIGLGGVGKTALAVTWARNHANRFRDGHLYADLCGFSPDSTATPTLVLAGFLRALGVEPDQVPITLAEQVGLYRTITATRRMMLVVVLDNAVSVQQVRPLIPASAGCVVVVTSHRNLEGLFSDGAQFIEVPPLDQEHAEVLLTELLGTERARKDVGAVAELAHLCGCLPIALLVAAARLASHPKWPVSRVVEQLRNEQARLAALDRFSGTENQVTAVLDWARNELEPHVAELYRLLGRLPVREFGADLAAAVTGVAEPRITFALQTLVDASLLEEVHNDRYRFHDLVRLHARTQRAHDDDHVVPRAARWYLREMTRANLVVIPLRWRVSPMADELADEPPAYASDVDALDWLTGELPNVLAVLEDAFLDRHYELVWQLCEALWELMLYRRPFAEWLRSHELGIIAAQRCSDPVAESRLHYQLGRAHLDLDQQDLAARENQLAVDLAQAAGDRRTESAALEQLGRIAQARNDLDTAIECFTASLHLEDALGIPRGVAARHRRLGDAYVHAGRYDDAELHLIIAQQMFAELGSEKDEARTALGLARIDAHRQRFDVAVERLNRARLVLNRSASPAYESDVLRALAEVAVLNGNIEQARSYLTEAIALVSDLGGVSLALASAALAKLAPADEAEIPRNNDTA